MRGCHEIGDFGANVLNQNNGEGTLSDITRQAGVDDPRWSASAAFLDYDRDGRLDLRPGERITLCETTVQPWTF